jgi:arginine N-succinyltransferase
MLEVEGFAYEDFIDIFDGGPTMTARIDNVKSVAEARADRIVRIDGGAGEKRLLASGRLAGFRCCYGIGELTEGGIAIDPASAETLNLREGDEVWSVRR